MAIYIDDRELVAAHRAGDNEAFDELVREHRDSLLAHAKRKLNCDASAEDALQETLVRAYKALPKFDGEYRLGPWLHRIMHNVCIDEAVRRHRDGEKANNFSTQPIARSDAPSVEDELDMHFDGTELNLALDDLSASHREALVLRFVDELNYDEVAQVSGVSEQTARARVSRARSAMRVALKGVAAFPLLAIGLLKRGEKAAAAATSASATTVAAQTSGVAPTALAQASSSSAILPAVTEAVVIASQAAPVAMPVIAKAAVGIGLAAAVFAPTSDSAIHQAFKDLSSGAVGLVSEEVEVLVEDQQEFVASVVFQEETGNEEDLGSPLIERSLVVEDAAVETEALVATAPQVKAPIRPEGSSNGDELGSAERIIGATPTIDLSESTELLMTSLLAQSLTFDDQGNGRYGISGSANAISGLHSVASDIDPRSSLWLATEELSAGQRRFQMEILTHQGDGSALTLRIAGYAMDEQSGILLKGIASISHPSIPEPQIANVTGHMNLGVTTGSAQFNFGS